MAEENDAQTVLRHSLYELLDSLAEKIPLSFAFYDEQGRWMRLYHDASPATLCGFARRASPTSGRCRDDEAQMARRAVETGEVQRDTCWQGTMRFVVPIQLHGKIALAVSLCGFGVDAAAKATDYLPADMQEALGLSGGKPREEAFSRDDPMDKRQAEAFAELLVRALRLEASLLET